MILYIIKISLTIIIASLVLYILKLIKRQRFFKTHGIPYEEPLPIFGNIFPVITRKKSIGDIVKKLYDINPNAKYFGFYDFTNPVIVIRDLELVKSVAVKNFECFADHGLLGPNVNDRIIAEGLFHLKGEKWQEVRNLLSPAFTSRKMKTLYELISISAINFVDYLSSDMEGNQMREMKEIFSRCSNDVIANCAFGISVNSMKEPKNDFYILGKEGTNFATLYLKIIFMRGFPFLMKHLGVKLLRSMVESFFYCAIRETINTRDTMGITRPDILQLLMDARGKDKKLDLTPEKIAAQAFVIYFGGFDTTSTMMSFMAHELAVNPEIQTRLQEEIDPIFNDTNANPSYDVINDLEYLDAVVNETLRKYPSFAALDRRCSKQFELPPTVSGAKPVVMKPGMMIWIPVIGYHYDPNYYQEPEKFNPDRFLKNGTSAAPFFTFGVGPRKCVGGRFGILLMKTVFFHLLSRFNLKVCSKTNIPIKLSCKSLGFGARGGYWIELEKRKIFDS